MAQPLYAPQAPPGGDPSYPTTRTAAVDDRPRWRIGLREAVVGILGLFVILGIVLAILGFAAAIGLDQAADEAADNDGADADDVVAGFAALPAVLVSLLPFLAAPVLALGCGAWAGHATRSARLGAIAGGIGGFLGPLLTLLLTGMGFALGAGAAGLDLGDVNLPGIGVSPAWADTLPYAFSGAGLLWMLANALSGALSGGLVGALLDRWVDRRAEMRRVRTARRTTRV